MTPMRIHFIGTGDAFGSGGRGQTCIRIETPTARVLLDCGASALEGLNRVGIETNTIDAVLVSHLLGDHFGGLPFFLLEPQLPQAPHDPHELGPARPAGGSGA
jgi:ribonuclease BN (tRNA processing enzyme)